MMYKVCFSAGEILTLQSQRLGSQRGTGGGEGWTHQVSEVAHQLRHSRKVGAGPQTARLGPMLKQMARRRGSGLDR